MSDKPEYYDAQGWRWVPVTTPQIFDPPKELWVTDTHAAPSKEFIPAYCSPCHAIIRWGSDTRAIGGRVNVANYGKAYDRIPIPPKVPRPMTIKEMVALHFKGAMFRKVGVTRFSRVYGVVLDTCSPYVMIEGLHIYKSDGWEYTLDGETFHPCTVEE